MRLFSLCALGALLPCAVSAASLYSTSPVTGGGDMQMPSTGAGSFGPLGAPSGPTGSFGAPSGYSPYPGYSGVSASPFRSQALGLKASALNSLALGTKSRSLRHHWAVGVDSIPAASLAQPSGSLVAVPSALDVRWWATDRLGLDILAGGNYNSAQAGKGELSPLLSSAPGDAFYAAGLGLRYNLSELSHDLLSQIVVKASGAQAAGSISGWSGKATQTTLAVFVGAGFEAFIPGWNWLSVEGSAGLTGFSQSLTPQGSAAQTVSGLGLAGAGFSPINLAAHAYF